MELNPCEDIEFIREKWIEFIVELNNQLNFLDISYFNMHLGYVMTNRLNKNKEKYLNNMVDFFNKLSAKINCLITIENTYTKGGDFSNMGSCVEDFIYIFNNNKNIKFCYDSGHDLICKSEYFLLEDKTKLVHLSDNNGEEDEHLGISKGKLSFEELNKILHINPQFLVLEMSFEEIKESLYTLKENYLK